VKFQKTILTSSSIQLKPLTETDYSVEYAAWLNNKLVNRYLETRWENQTEENLKTFLRNIEKDKNSVLYGIIYDGKHIGNIKVGPIDWNHLKSEIGYFIGNSEYLNKGLATEAVVRVTRFAFEDLGLNKCHAGAYSGNLSSCKVLKKAGYTLEGCQKNSLLGPEGWEDHLLYGYEKRNFK